MVFSSERRRARAAKEEAAVKAADRIRIEEALAPYARAVASVPGRTTSDVIDLCDPVPPAPQPQGNSRPNRPLVYDTTQS